MKVADLFKHRGDKQHSELMQWVSPAVREYWGEFLHKTNNRHLFTRLRDLQRPAVNDEVQAPAVSPKAEPKPIELKPEAQNCLTNCKTNLVKLFIQVTGSTCLRSALTSLVR